MSDEILSLHKQLLQLSELRATEALSEVQYNESRDRVERRLAEIESNSEPAVVVPPARQKAWLIAFIVLVGLGSAGGYLWFGRSGNLPGSSSPSAQSAGADAGQKMPGELQASAHSVSAEQINSMTDRLAARLKDQPNDADGWAMLGRSYAVTGKYPEATAAFRKASALHPEDPVLLADFADALAVTANHSFEGEPLQLIERALRIAPDNLKALSMAGTAAFVRKDYAKALSYWDKLEKVAPGDSVFVQQVRPGIDEARQLAKGRLPLATGTSFAPTFGASTAPK